MFNGTKKRLFILADRRKNFGTRLFAFLEVFCFYFSIAALMAVLDLTFARVFGYELPRTAVKLLQIALTAAIGFLTNWLAIEMLFKPYEPIKWLWVWPQGLVPRNKAEIGVKAGEKISTELLNPTVVSERLCKIISGLWQSDVTKEEIVGLVRKFIDTYKDDIVKSVVPLIESSLVKILKENVTPDKFQAVWDEEILPRLKSDEVQTMLAEKIVNGLQKHSPQFIPNLKRWLRDYLHRWADRNTFVRVANLVFEDAIVDFIDWGEVSKMINQKLQESETQKSIKRILESYFEDFTRWLNSRESEEKLGRFIDGFRKRIEMFVKKYLEEEVPSAVNRLLVSPQLYGWLNKDFIPSVKPQMETYLQKKMPEVLGKLDYQKIISEAIDSQDVHEFHKMVNDVAAEHLGAIQVLGFFLGGMIGLVQAIW